MHRHTFVVLLTSLLIAGCNLAGTKPSAGSSTSPEASIASPAAPSRLGLRCRFRGEDERNIRHVPARVNLHVGFGFA